MTDITAATPAARSAFIRGGLSALLCLALGLPLIFGLAFLVERLPGHMDLFRYPATGFALFFVFSGAGGWLWGRSLARLAGVERGGRLAWAAALSFPVAAFLAVLALGRLEVILVEERALGNVPIYLIFAVLFTLSSFFVAAAVGAALGAALGDSRLALALALEGGLASGAGFLAADIVQHLLGRVVGGPNAAATATMLTVMAIGHAVAAFCGGGAIARRLRLARER